MALYTRGAAARNQQAKSEARKSRAKAGKPPESPRNDNRDPLRFKLMVNRQGVCSLTANSHTLGQIEHHIETYSNAKVTAHQLHMDAGSRVLEVVVDRPELLDKFTLDRIAALGSQLK